MSDYDGFSGRYLDNGVPVVNQNQNQNQNQNGDPNRVPPGFSPIQQPPAAGGMPARPELGMVQQIQQMQRLLANPQQRMMLAQRLANMSPAPPPGAAFMPMQPGQMPQGQGQSPLGGLIGGMNQQPFNPMNMMQQFLRMKGMGAPGQLDPSQIPGQLQGPTSLGQPWGPTSLGSLITGSRPNLDVGVLR